MVHILIAIGTLTIGALLVSFGTYGGYHSIKRAQLTSVLGHAFERQLVYIYSVYHDIGRIPDSSILSMGTFTRENIADIEFSYVKTGTYGYVCAMGPSTEVNIEAFEIVSGNYKNGLYGSTCNTGGGPAGGVVSITVRIN